METQPSNVVVVSDSTSSVPAALLERWDVEQVSLYVGFDGALRPESEWTDLDAFYAELEASADVPTTSQPSVGDFLACYEPLLAAGRDVVSIHLSGGLSGTCESAREAAATLAARGHAGRVEVVDGETGAGPLGLLVLTAAQAARNGASVEAVLEAVADARRRLHMWFCLDTLEYLRRGGRIGAAQALLGSALQIKPILTFGSEIAPVGRVRTHRRALERMVAYLRELHTLGATDWIVQHAQAEEDAQLLVREGTAILGCPPRFCTQVGPVLGAHLGRGVLVGGLAAAFSGSGQEQRADFG